MAELVPAVVAWARGPWPKSFAAASTIRASTITEGDVGDIIRARAGAYDAILLDVDNGPDGLTLSANDRLYDGPGLAAARAALKPGGVLAVWSSGPTKASPRRLRKAGFEVEERPVRAGRARGARHMIWLPRQHEQTGESARKAELRLFRSRKIPPIPIWAPAHHSREQDFVQAEEQNRKARRSVICSGLIPVLIANSRFGP